MNAEKTAFITIETKHDKAEDDHKLQIKVNEKLTIKEDEQLKILGFRQNRRNLMDSYLSAIA